jgi:hypothetical protein
MQYELYLTSLAFRLVRPDVWFLGILGITRVFPAYDPHQTDYYSYEYCWIRRTSKHIVSFGHFDHSKWVAIFN